MNILLGMSGGVDSSASAIVLKNMGHNVSGLTLKLLCDCDEDAKSVCDKIGIPYEILNLENDFRNTVIENFLSEYLRGATPNPCIVCNENIKFGKMLDYALSKGFDKIATGHYAKIEEQNGRFLLKKPTDINKDQTYVLYGLTQHQLSHTLFPLGNLTKEEARNIAEMGGLVNARKKDSQDICFVPDGDYAAFIEKNLNKKLPIGNFTNVSGKILGKHKGIIHYTIGQRKGLGIALGKPCFVIDKNAETGDVVLGDEEFLFCKMVNVEKVNFIPFNKLENDIRAKVKLRYRHTEQWATIHPTGENSVVVEFDEPQRAPAIGQSAVFYDGDYCIGGGLIKKGYNND